MAALIWPRGPSSSRQTTPISSVTLACRTLVTTLNLRPSSQITGLGISLGGYISHKRVFCGCALSGATVDLDFFARGGMILASIFRSRVVRRRIEMKINGGPPPYVGGYRLS